MKEEIWKKIDGYNNMYEISSYGRVKSYYGNGKFLIGHPNTSGYLHVSLCPEYKVKRSVKIHQLVAEYFIGNRENKVVNHKDGDRTNNCVDNLELISNRENVTHGFINLKKTSKYTGVYWDKDQNKWAASVYFKGKTKRIGRYTTEIEAAKAYQEFLEENNFVNKYMIQISA